MKAQYEQHCNAAALKGLGVKVIKKLKKKHAPKIEEWTKSDNIIHVGARSFVKEELEFLTKHKINSITISIFRNNIPTLMFAIFAQSIHIHIYRYLY